MFVACGSGHFPSKISNTFSKRWIYGCPCDFVRRCSSMLLLLFIWFYFIIHRTVTHFIGHQMPFLSFVHFLFCFCFFLRFSLLLILCLCGVFPLILSSEKKSVTILPLRDRHLSNNQPAKQPKTWRSKYLQVVNPRSSFGTKVAYLSGVSFIINNIGTLRYFGRI